jgi:precorrin-2 dehydrogenase/sirohydrochlorin ferrochelatase
MTTEGNARNSGMCLHDSIAMLRYYPVFLNLQDKLVLVVGAGKVALRKTQGLVEAGARVKVIAPDCDPDFKRLPVEVVCRKFRKADLKGAVLAFTATDDRNVNRAAAQEAKRRGIPINVADARAECDFIVPSLISRGKLQFAVSTGGENPRLAADLRRII